MRNCRYNLLLLFVSIPFFVMSQQRILVLGDSHGATENGWVNQLKKLRPDDRFLYLSLGGNTIGFRNLDRDTLNTLKNIHSYLERGKKHFGEIDKIIILLGTNDCKAVFKDSLHLVAHRFGCMIDSIQNEFINAEKPQIVYITPPVFANDNELTEKYKGGNSRLKILIPQLLHKAKKQGIKYIHLNKKMGRKAGEMTTDGVHYSDKGYEVIATIINKYL